MPTIAGRTLAQILTDVGYNLMGAGFIVSTVSEVDPDADGTGLLDNVRLWGGNDVHNGKWARLTSGADSGVVRRVNDYIQGTAGGTGNGNHEAVIAPAYPAGTIAANTTYELWSQEFHPDIIKGYIRDAILDVYGRAYAPVEDLSLHTGGGTTNTSSASSTLLRTGGDSRFDVPDTIDVIDSIQHRVGVSSQELHGCERVFDETVDADITVTVDSTRRRRGNSSTKFVVGAGVSNGDLASDSIPSIDISDKTHVELWVYCATAVVASDLVISLDDTAGHGSPLETLAVPAIAADTWTFVRLALTVPEDLTAIVSIALEYNANSGANTIWLDDIQAIDDNSAIWGPVSRRGWWLEKGNRDLVLTEECRIDIGYALLKLIGGDSPLLLSADTDVNEIDDLFVIYRATELAFQANATNNPEYLQQAGRYAQRAAQRRRHLHRFRNARKAS